MMQPIRVGIGGWTFAPWRGPFYPAGLTQAKELAYAAGRLTAIEINGTFYRTQSPASFAKWAAEVPDGFVFSLKAPRVTTHRTALAESEPSIARFLDSGLSELGDRLGPILWQFPPTRRFDPAAFATFLTLLPASHGGVALRHVVEARHESFAVPEWFALLQKHKVAAAIVESDKHTLLGDLTAPFVYARLQHNAEAEPEGYAADALDRWADRATRWAAGKAVEDLPLARPPAKPVPRDCFIFFISGDKVRAPDAAQAFIARCKT
ncbi:DUF72 domain-containing protein [Acidisphaera sp. L21]|uniref:DUF72 domain-containing protein n=1 Tax=Acidisphaera sp. L21 TaxID=1641851 RepID=UPI001C20B55C|nr:DUF72 domain-containing protein [Acidisphaera sp. L21]